MASRRVLNLETGRTAQPAEALTPNSDRTIFSASYSPVVDTTVLPYGVETGGVITPGATADQVVVASSTVVMADVATATTAGRVAVASETLTLSRPDPGEYYHAAIYVDDGIEYKVMYGSPGGSLVAEYDTPGGAPLIPVNAVLIGLVRLDDTSAVVNPNDILQFPGAAFQSQERWDSPQWVEPEFNFAKTVEGEIEFRTALPDIHVGNTPKRVILRGSSPIFQRINAVSSFTPAEISVSSSSTDTFDGPIAEQSQSVSDGSFELSRMMDGVRDAVISVAGSTRLVQFLPDELNPNVYIWTQGVIAPTRSFSGSASATANVTIAATGASVNVGG